MHEAGDLLSVELLLGDGHVVVLVPDALVRERAGELGRRHVLPHPQGEELPPHALVGHHVPAVEVGGADGDGGDDAHLVPDTGESRELRAGVVRVVDQLVRQLVLARLGLGAVRHALEQPRVGVDVQVAAADRVAETVEQGAVAIARAVGVHHPAHVVAHLPVRLRVREVAADVAEHVVPLAADLRAQDLAEDLEAVVVGFALDADAAGAHGLLIGRQTEALLALLAAVAALAQVERAADRPTRDHIHQVASHAKSSEENTGTEVCVRTYAFATQTQWLIPELLCLSGAPKDRGE